MSRVREALSLLREGRTNHNDGDDAAAWNLVGEAVRLLIVEASSLECTRCTNEAMRPSRLCAEHLAAGADPDRDKDGNVDRHNPNAGGRGKRRQGR